MYVESGTGPLMLMLTLMQTQRIETRMIRRRD
jgi:hypothetical protein